MVASKKCKVCKAIDADNIAIYGEYFEKSLPDLIEKISGIKIDPHKANGVLICKLCAVQLVQTDVIIDRLRSTLQRLTKFVKETKPKTPSKDAADKPKSNVARRKSITLDNSLDTRGEQLKENIESTNLIPTKSQDVPKTNTPKKVVCRKSFVESRNEEKIQDGEADIKNVDTEGTFVNGDSNSNKKVEQKAKVPKKTVRRKSVIQNNNLTHSEVLEQNGDRPNNISTTKFKKIVDNEVKLLKAAKRKEMSNENGFECGSKSLNNSDICESTPVKRNKTVSLTMLEANPIDLDTDKIDLTGSFDETLSPEVKIKILNCVICGKGFSQKSSLRQHIESSHMGEKLKQCFNCSAEFKSQQKYESHVFSEKCKNSKHACQYPNCKRRFKTIYKMELHMQENHSLSQQQGLVQD